MIEKSEVKLFSMNNAVVICRQLGFGYAHQFVSNLHYWQAGEDGYDGVLMSGLKCEGDEMSIQQCKFDASLSCPSKYKTPYTGLVCTERAGDLVIDIPLLESSLHMSRVSTGFLQFKSFSKNFDRNPTVRCRGKLSLADSLLDRVVRSAVLGSVQDSKLASLFG